MLTTASGRLVPYAIIVRPTTKVGTGGAGQPRPNRRPAGRNSKREYRYQRGAGRLTSPYSDPVREPRIRGLMRDSARERYSNHVGVLYTQYGRERQTQGAQGCRFVRKHRQGRCRLRAPPGDQSHSREHTPPQKVPLPLPRGRALPVDQSPPQSQSPSSLI